MDPASFYLMIWAMGAFIALLCLFSNGAAVQTSSAILAAVFAVLWPFSVVYLAALCMLGKAKVETGWLGGISIEAEFNIYIPLAIILGAIAGLVWWMA